MVALALLLLTALLAFANGANDVSKGIATLVGSGVSDYRRAVLWGSSCTVAGAMAAAFVSQALVATFSGKGVFAQPPISETFLLAIGCGAIGWLALATYSGLPVSTTHSLAGALVGAALMQSGPRGVAWGALLSKIALPLAVSPLTSMALLLVILPLLQPAIERHIAERQVCY